MTRLQVKLGYRNVGVFWTNLSYEKSINDVDRDQGKMQESRSYKNREGFRKIGLLWVECFMLEGKSSID